MIILAGRFVYRTKQFTMYYCQRLINTKEVEPNLGDSDDTSYSSKSQFTPGIDTPSVT